MLSYQHQYHAGNFADIHKHLCLIGALSYLHKKDKPVSVIDTHAGSGWYHLDNVAAQRTQEANDGIRALWPTLSSADDALLHRYYEIIRTHLRNRGTRVSYYPGSPMIALAMARQQDNWTGFELHPQAYETLSAQLIDIEGQHHCHQRDAFEGLRATLPNTHPRALAIIDPSYEIKSDYAKLPTIIANTLKTKRQTIILLWYPILSANRHEKMILRIQQQTANNQVVLISEWRPDFTAQHEPTSTNSGMLGSGIAIINPPWQLDNQLNQTARILQVQSPFDRLIYHQVQTT